MITSVAYKDEINNENSPPTVLATFQDIDIIYNPIRQQVFLSNNSSILAYSLQYTFFGNTASYPTIPYTALPAGIAGAGTINLEPDTTHYPSFDGSGHANTGLNVPFINCKFIWKDLTITDQQGNSLGCEMNNQHIRKNINRILLQGVETSLD